MRHCYTSLVKMRDGLLVKRTAGLELPHSKYGHLGHQNLSSWAFLLLVMGCSDLIFLQDFVFFPPNWSE